MDTLNRIRSVRPTRVAGSWRDRRKIVRFLRYLLLSLLGLMLVSLLVRNPLLTFYLDKKLVSFNRTYHAELKVERARIRWFSSLRITGIMLRPEGGDTLLQIDTVYARLSFFRMLAGRISLKDFELGNTRLSFVRHDSVTNYMFLLDLRGKKRLDDSSYSGVSYAARLSGLLRAAFDLVPNSVHIGRFRVTSNTNGHVVSLSVDYFSLEDHRFRTPVDVAEDAGNERWTLEGRLDHDERLASFRLYAADTGKVRIPYLLYRVGADVRFDTLAFSLQEKSDGSDLTSVSGEALLTGLRVSHPRIAMRPVLFDRLGMQYTFNAGKDYMEIDSATTVTFNHLEFNPYVRYEHSGSKKITLSLHKSLFAAEDLFSSIPEGLFTTMGGIRVNGRLSFDLNFHVDLARPDSLLFSAELGRSGFRVESWGDGELLKMKEPFEYTAYEKGEPVRTFMVGPENPQFRRLDQIPDYLQASVLTSEDGGFFQHRGFLPDALRESLATDIREMRFARGGSTISMQLVKNVFLSRNKTLARKLEEMLIVWLIENQGVYTKERMFEVYLNIIEWGPMVYGANEGAHFYFSKDVSKLSLAEAIFMASVIPRPKWFRYSFDKQGHLQPYMAEYYRLVSSKMLRKGWISQKEFDELVPEVVLKGPARLMLSTPELPEDTIQEGLPFGGSFPPDSP
jgi:hypothetical protein